MPLLFHRTYIRIGLRIVSDMGLFPDTEPMAVFMFTTFLFRVIFDINTEKNFDTTLITLNLLSTKLHSIKSYF
jgi:hypothetical protein